MISSTTLIDSRSAHTGICMSLMEETMCCGMPLVVSSQEYSPAAVTIISICEIRNTELWMMRQRSRKPTSR